MELKSNQYVVFSNGDKHGYLEARWSDKYGAFINYLRDENNWPIRDPETGKSVFLLSNDVREKAPRKRKKFVPSAANCPKELDVCDETEKAYAYYTGLYGLNGKPHKEWIAKSVCYVDENGKVFAPLWAVGR